MATIGVKIELEGAPQFKENMSNLKAQTKMFQAQLKSLSSQMGSNVSAFRKSVTESKALEQVLDAQKNQLKLLEDQIDKTTEKYGEDSTQVIRLKTEYQNLTAQIAQTTAELEAHGGTLGAIGAEFQEIGEKIAAVGEKVSGVGDKLTKSVTAPIAGIAAAGVKTAASFDSSMSQVAATMGYTVDELNDSTSDAAKTMQQLGDFAKEMGATTAFSASEAADALNYMALAGYDAETSMQMLPTVLNLAAAGGIDLASASDMVTDAQSALGLSLEETSSLVDQMAKASSKSNTSVAQLGEALLTIGATGANVSGGTAELATSLGVLADNGIKGAEGGTHLRNMILSLQDAAKDGAVDFGDFSVQVYDAEGNFRAMSDIMQEVSSNMNGMSQESKDAIVSGVFNKTDLASVNAMLNTSADRFSDLKKEIGDATGAAQDMADVQLNNLNGQITLLKSAIEGAAISIGEALMPYITKMVEHIQKAVDWFNNLSESQRDMVIKIGLLVAAIGPALSVIGRVITVGSKLFTGIGSFISFIPKITGFATTIGTLLTGTIIPAIAGVVSAIIPFLPIIAGVAAAITAVIIVIKNWGAITDWISEKWATLSTFLNTVVTEIQAFFEEHFGILGEIISTKIAIIKTIITTTVEVIRLALVTFGQVVKALFTGDWASIGDIMRNAWNKLKVIIQNGITTIVQKISGLGGSIRDIFAGMANNAKEWGSHLINNFIDGIRAKFDEFVNTIKSLAKTVEDYLGFTLPDKGPLHFSNLWPIHFMENYANGIDAARYLVKDAVADVAQDVTVLANPIDQTEVYNAVRAGASAANITLTIGDREFKRTMREMGVTLNGY